MFKHLLFAVATIALLAICSTPANAQCVSFVPPVGGATNNAFFGLQSFDSFSLQRALLNQQLADQIAFQRARDHSARLRALRPQQVIIRNGLFGQRVTVIR